MNFIKSALANLQTGNQFIVGFQAGFAFTLLGVLLLNFLPLQNAKSPSPIMTKQVLAASTKLLTPTPTPTATPTPTPTLTPKQLHLANLHATPSASPTPTIHFVKLIMATPTQTPTPTQKPTQNQQTTSSSDPSVNSLLNMINAERSAHGAPALSLDGTISNCALAHSKQMAAQHGLFHNLDQDACAPGYHAKAENVGMSTEQPAQAINTVNTGMMNEGPGGGHYENIVNSLYKVVGIGIYFDGTTTWVTEDFEG